MWYVYIIKCRDGSYYTGVTNDLEDRFKDHLIGKGGHYTRSHKPIEISYSEKLPTKSKALKREIEIKNWRRDKKENLINSRHR